MKNSLIVCKVFLAMLVTLTLFSCQDSSKQDDTKELAEDQNDIRLENSPQKETSDFFVDIAEIELAEIEMAKLATKKSASAEVVKFASMLVTEHTKSSDELKKLADARQIALPASITEEGKDSYQELNEKSGHDFDKKFVDEMIEDHQKAIKEMEDASDDNDKDEAVKVWSSNKIATLTSHLQHAKMIKEKLNNKQ